MAAGPGLRRGHLVLGGSRLQPLAAAVANLAFSRQSLILRRRLFWESAFFTASSSSITPSTTRSNRVLVEGHHAEGPSISP